MCRDVRRIDALGFVLDGTGRPVVGAKAPTLFDSNCNFCLSCVEVCPTGSLRLKFEEPRMDGERVSRCVANCPAGMDIPRYLREIRRGEFARAEAVIREAAPLPRVLGQVCFRPCEDACLRDDVSEAVAICSLKRAALEHSGESLWKSRLNPRPPTGKKVAIVGAGPAGLTASWFLKLKGHDVTLFDSQPAPGGWLRNGIPPHRLDRRALAADVADIADLGIEFKMGVEVGGDVTFDALRGDHDAVFIAAGARKGKDLPCEGTELPGVESGLEMLERLTGEDGFGNRPYDGEKVVVIGGGNGAMDVARTALRLGPDEVHIYCLEEREEMPAHAWEIREAEEEGIVMHPGWGPKLITGEAKVERVDFRKCTSVYGEGGRFAPEFDEGVMTSQKAQRVLVAIGQEPALGFLEGIDSVVGGTLKVDAGSMQTSLEGVFAGGEVVSGPSSVVEAIEQGRRAASGIDSYLGGDGDIDFRLVDEAELDVELAQVERFAELSRTPVPHLPVEEAVACFTLVETGYTPEHAMSEASRCLRCDLRLHAQSVPLPPESWLDFTAENVSALPESEGVYQLLDEEKVVYAIKGVDNLRSALSEIVETSTKAKFFLYEEDPMYSKRESELIQDYLREHGCMPPGEGEDDLDDLF
jgi:NADPH-dependent glutamate synthase beta subunit-like oxidoreductase